MPDTPQYDTSQLDEVQHPTLGPLKFPHAMPPEERNTIIEGMEKNAQSTAKPAAQTAPPQQSFWQRAWKSLNQKLPRPPGGGEEEELADSASSGLSELGDMAKESAEKQQTDTLTRAAKTGQQPGAGDKTSLFMKNALASTLKMGAGAVSPQGQATAAGMVFAPEIVGPAIAAHGLATTAAHAPGAVKGNPEEAERALGGAAETVGGAAGTADAFSGVPNTVNLARRSMAATRQAIGSEMTPTQAMTVRPEGAFQPALANTPKDVLQHATQEGIDLTPFQATGSRVAGKLQVAGEHGIVGGQPLEEALNTQRANFGESVNRMSERLDPKRMGLSEEQAGESIKQSAQTAKDVAHTNAQDAYKNLKGMATTPVDPTPITKAWMSMRGSLPMGIEEQVLSQVPRDMRAQVEEMLSPTGTKAPLTFDQSIALRSFFREMGDAEGLPNRLEGAFKQLAKSADSAMESAAQKGGFDKEWRSANEGWKDYTGKYGDKQSPLYRILRQADPAKVTRDLMNRASANDIEILQNEKMDGAIEALRRQVVQDIARNKFTVGRGGLGGYQDSFLQQLFGKAGAKELYLKADLARRMNWDPNPSGSGGQLLVGEQLGKPSKVAQLFGAAKLSMPRPAAGYLPKGSPTPYRIDPRFATAALTATRNNQ